MIYFQVKDHGDAADVMILHILIDIRSTLSTCARYVTRNTPYQ